MSEHQQEGGEPYIVTRGKPPREHMFKPGQSGNPRGRPKGAKAIDVLLEEELDRKIAVTVNGRRTKLSRRQMMVRQLVDKALKGDHKAVTTCLALQRAKAPQAGKDASAPGLAEEFDAQLDHDERILLSFLARTQGGVTSDD